MNMRSAVLRGVNPANLIPGSPFIALRVGKVFAPNGKELPGNVTDIKQLREMVTFFEKAQRPTGDYPLIDFDHAAVGPLTMISHPERSIPLGVIIAMRVVGDGLEVTPAWTKHGREIMDKGEGLLSPSAFYTLDAMHDRATGQRVAGAMLAAVAMTPKPATRPDQLGAVRAALGELEALCVSYRLPPETAGAWPTIEGADPPDGPPHVTIAYVLVPPAAVEAAKEMLRTAVRALAPFGLTITGGVHAFAPDTQGRTPVVAAVQSEGACAAHEQLIKGLRAAGLPVEETHQGYVPHATMGYVRGDYKCSGPTRSDLTVSEMELWHGDGEPERLPMKPAPQGAQPAASAVRGKPMGLEEILAALPALSPEDKAKVKAAIDGGEAAARGADAAPAPAAAATNPADVARSKDVADLQAWRSKMEAEQAAAAETAAINAEIARKAAKPGEEAVMRSAWQARSRDGGAAWKSFTDRPSGSAFSTGVIGDRAPVAATTAAGSPGADEKPPTDRSGFARFALRSLQAGEQPAEAIARVRRAFPEQSLAAFGSTFVADPNSDKVVTK